MNIDEKEKDKKFKCTYLNCTYETDRKEHLETHIKYKHTKEKPFKCSYPSCIYESVENSMMTRHIKSKHRNEKPFKCNYENCIYECVRKDQLKSHSKIHTKEGQAKQKKSEEYTFKLLQEFGITNLKREHRIEFNCLNETYCRIDYLYIYNGNIFLIENDEEQHQHYMVSCEVKRMTNVVSVLFEDGNTMPLIWIRINPDNFNIDGKKIKMSKQEKIEKVVKLINSLSQTTQELPLLIYYCFYNMVDKQPEILQDESYPEALKSIVKYLI